jgi:D-beta-D-heptose 7-phosphate kinase/D-beta-D-heptose 1-phosphate adenosyltransferase
MGGLCKKKKRATTVVAVSGYFDPLHIGHVRYIQAAKKLGDILWVILNTDEQAVAKKGYCFMPYKERSEILLAMKDVNAVLPNIDNDGSVAQSLSHYHPNIFAKGGDRGPFTLPPQEIITCNNLNIEIRYNVGGEKLQSSSELVRQRLK